MFPAVTDLLPHRPPFLFVDQIVEADENRLVARRHWRQDEDFYKGHYPSEPITPGVILCEATIQAGALFLALRRRNEPGGPGIPILARISDVRFRRPIRPGETTVTEVKCREFVAGFCLMSGLMTCEGARVLNIEFSVTAKESGSLQGSSPAA